MKVPERVRCVSSFFEDGPVRGRVYHVERMLGNRLVLLGLPQLWKGKEIGHNPVFFRIIRYHEN